MLELMFLLLPVAACYGWYMGYRSAKQKSLFSHTNDYFTGLNYLFSKQEDHLDHALENLTLHDQNYETHMHLGEFFRQRGDLNKAIRIHQNITSQSKLTKDDHFYAMMALAKDYIAAGFFDRAETILLLLAKEDHGENVEVERQLFRCYQITKDWEQGLYFFEQMPRYSKKLHKKTIAQFYCEQAMQKRHSERKQALFQAIKYDRTCIRAWLSLVSFYHDEGEHTQLKRCTRMILRFQPAYLVEVIYLIENSYAQEQRLHEYEQLLCTAIESHQSATLICALVDFWLKTNDPNKLLNAKSIITNRLKKFPSLKAFEKLIQIHIEEHKLEKAKDSLIELRSIVLHYLHEQKAYKCHTCGLKTSTIYWLCPSCHEWSSIERTVGFHGE